MEYRIVQKEQEVNTATQAEEFIDRISNRRFEVRLLLQNRPHNIHLPHLHIHILVAIILALTIFSNALLFLLVLTDGVVALHTLIDHIAMFSKQFILAVSKLDIVIKVVTSIATLVGFKEVAKAVEVVKVVANSLVQAEQKELMREEQLNDQEKDLVVYQLEQVEQQAVSVPRVATFPYASCLCPCLSSSFSLDHFLDR